MDDSKLFPRMTAADMIAMLSRIDPTTEVVLSMGGDVCAIDVDFTGMGDDGKFWIDADL